MASIDIHSTESGFKIYFDGVIWGTVPDLESVIEILNNWKLENKTKQSPQ